MALGDVCEDGERPVDTAGHWGLVAGVESRSLACVLGHRRLQETLADEDWAREV